MALNLRRRSCSRRRPRRTCGSPSWPG
jgi:hypothetical protein